MQEAEELPLVVSSSQAPVSQQLCCCQPFNPFRYVYLSSTIAPLDGSGDMPTDDSSSGIGREILLAPSNKRIHCLRYPCRYRECFSTYTGTSHGATARTGASWSSIRKSGRCFPALPFCLLTPVKTTLFTKLSHVVSQIQTGL